MVIPLASTASGDRGPAPGSAAATADGRCFEEAGRQVIFTKVRDPRLVTVRRGGSLRDPDHHLLAVWAANCAMHVLHLFEQAQPADERPRRAIELTRARARGEITMTRARAAAFAANAAAGGVRRREGSGTCCRASRGSCSCRCSRTRRSRLRDQGRPRVGQCG